MAGQRRSFQIQPTLGGVVHSYAFQKQPPFTLYDARDVLPIDTTTGRRRVAVRPGFAKADSGDSKAWQLITTLRSAPSETDKVQLMGVSTAAGTTSLWRFTSGAWSNVGSITTTSGTIQAASFNTKLYIACAAPYKYYTYSGHAIATWDASSAGTIPPNCTLTCTWGARVVLAGDPANPHVINLARSDDPHDWDFTETDTAAAVSFSIQEAATALIPHSRECLIIGTRDSMWILTGNPTKGGSLERFAPVVGPISGKAWCKTPDDWTYILTRDGLYRIPPGCGSPPQSVSRELVPDTLLGLDGVNYTAYLGYDVRWRGIYIFVEGASPYSYWYDIEGGGFWPITKPASTILDIHHYGPMDSSTKSGTLVGTGSGAYRLDSGQTLGGSDLAYFTLGPLPVTAVPTYRAKVSEAVLLLGELTDDTTGTVKFYTADKPELAVALPADRRYSITVGALINNRRCYPQLSGHALVIKYTQGATNKKFAFEGGGLVLMAGGRTR